MDHDDVDINKNELQINRGVELLLRNRRRESLAPKTFQAKFGKMITLFQREFDFYIDYPFNIRKQ